MGALRLIDDAASAFLAYFVAYKGYSAFKVTGRRYLVNFIAGFVILGTSYLVLPLVLQPPGLTVSPSLEWVRLLAQASGFALVGSSYYTRARKGENIMLGAFLLLIIIATIVDILFPPLALRVSSTDALLFMVNAILALYIAHQVAFAGRPGGRFKVQLVGYGFGGLLASQYTWLVWSFDGGLFAFGLAQTMRLIGLAVLALAVVLVEKQER